MENLKALQKAFEHAISLAPDAQNAYLEQLQHSDPDLHHQLVTLLVNDARTDSFVQHPISSVKDAVQPRFLAH